MDPATGRPSGEGVNRPSFDGLDVCVLSDALDALGLEGAVAGIRPVWESACLWGRVITMSVSPAAGERPARHLGAAAIDRAEPHDVIVVAFPEGAAIDRDAAAWGGLLSRAALAREVAGVVIDGACRDVDEIRQMAFPVSARRIVPFTARRRLVERDVGETVRIGGVSVSPGDYVIADGSGVVFVPGGEAARVTASARRILEREGKVLHDLRRGVPASLALGRDYEAMLDEH